MTKRVLITGGSRGIGKAIAECYISAGFQVVSPSREELELSSTESINKYLATPENIAIDVLINNAAENTISEIDDLSLDAWQRMMTINLTAPFLLIKFISKFMRQNNWGRIVNISSCYSLVGRIGRSAYGATKSGLNSLTRSAALELAPHNILVNSVLPGFIETDLTHQNNSPKQIQALCKQIPLNRLGTAEEIANLVFFLGTEKNTYITGQHMIVDGGFLAQ